MEGAMSEELELRQLNQIAKRDKKPNYKWEISSRSSCAWFSELYDGSRFNNILDRTPEFRNFGLFVDGYPVWLADDEGKRRHWFPDAYSFVKAVYRYYKDLLTEDDGTTALTETDGVTENHLKNLLMSCFGNLTADMWNELALYWEDRAITAKEAFVDGGFNYKIPSNFPIPSYAHAVWFTDLYDGFEFSDELSDAAESGCFSLYYFGNPFVLAAEDGNSGTRIRGCRNFCRAAYIDFLKLPEEHAEFLTRDSLDNIAMLKDLIIKCRRGIPLDQADAVALYWEDEHTEQDELDFLWREIDRLIDIVLHEKFSKKKHLIYSYRKYKYMEKNIQSEGETETDRKNQKISDMLQLLGISAYFGVLKKDFVPKYRELCNQLSNELMKVLKIETKKDLDEASAFIKRTSLANNAANKTLEDGSNPDLEMLLDYAKEGDLDKLIKGGLLETLKLQDTNEKK